MQPPHLVACHALPITTTVAAFGRAGRFEQDLLLPSSLLTSYAPPTHIFLRALHTRAAHAPASLHPAPPPHPLLTLRLNTTNHYSPLPNHASICRARGGQQHARALFKTRCFCLFSTTTAHYSQRATYLLSPYHHLNFDTISLRFQAWRALRRRTGVF